MPEGLRLALTTFTVAPLRSARVDRATARAAMIWSPLVGAVLAGVAAAVLLLGRWLYVGPTVWIGAVHVEYLEGPLLAAALAIVTLALLTRGLHLDGLADTVDGLASHRTADQALAVMRDGPVGPMGALALAGLLLLDVLALATSVLAHHGTQALVVAVVTGRLAMVWSCTPGVPAARAEGLGAMVAGTVPRTAAAAWTLAGCVGAGCYGALDPDDGSAHAAVRAVLAVLLPLALTWALRRHVVRRLGGITGDVLGAACELATLVSLLVCAAGRP